MDQFILFGDSITQQSFDQNKGFAFGAELSNAYVRRLDVVNRGLSGYNTDQALKILHQILPASPSSTPRLLTLFFGANDARLPNTPGGPQQNVPLEVYRENLTAILTSPHLTKHRDLRVILVTPPPVDERMLIEAGKAYGVGVATRKAANAASYARVAAQVGRECGVAVCDLWTAMMGRAGWQGESFGALPGGQEVEVNKILQSFLSDGLHFTPAGYSILFEEVMAVIEKTWPDQMPEKLPMVLPAWDDSKAWTK